MSHRILNWTLAAGIAAVLSGAYLLDGPDDHSAEWPQSSALTDAQRQAQAEARMERAAAQQCIKTNGMNAGYRWTPDDTLVCTDKRGRVAVAVRGSL